MNKVLNTLKLIKKEVKKFTVPSVTIVSEKHDPYLVLISCILSLRTKDKTTIEAANRLFHVARTPQDMVKLSKIKLQRLIYPVGFYRNKSRVIIDISKRILKDFQGKVPSDSGDLLSLRGVGRKTANLVLGLGFGIPAICVDTHVNRIPNRLGWIRTKDPFETEEALEKIIPRRLWIDLNTILVTFGQNICLPVRPRCAVCPAEKYCVKRGVK